MTDPLIRIAEALERLAPAPMPAPARISASIISGMATTVTAMSSQAKTSPAPPTSMMTISQNLTMRMICALSRVSANWPASADNRKKGRMKTAVATALNSASAFSSL